MVQIIQQIVILYKDNLSKYIIILIDDFID